MSVVSNVTTISIQPSSAPSWVSTLTLNAWTELSNPNTFRSVQPSPGIGGNPDAVMTAWGGAILATGLGTYGSMVHYGGGHTDYYGNEVYRMDLGTLTWSRMNNPSRAGSDTNNSPYGIRTDGTPTAIHGYHFMSYRPSSNSLVLGHRDITSEGGINYHGISILNLANAANPTAAWTCSIATCVPPLSYVSGYGGEGFVYDSARDGMWKLAMSSALDWAFYSFSADTWTAYTGPTGAFAQGPAVYVPTKDCVLFFQSLYNGVYGLDPASPNTERVDISTTGSGPSQSVLPNITPWWSSTLGKVVCYLSNSNSIYTLAPPSGNWRTGTWTWATVATTGSSGPHTGSGGYPTYGKFQVAQWGNYVIGILNDNLAASTYAIRLA